MKAEEVLESGWSGKTQWIDFKRDPAVDGLSHGQCLPRTGRSLSCVLVSVSQRHEWLPSVSADQYPGSVLLQIGMGPADSMPKSLSWLTSLAAQLPMRRRFELRVHIFQVGCPRAALSVHVLLCCSVAVPSCWRWCECMHPLCCCYWQARNLSAADSNGASDPYVVARYGGTVAKTAIRPVTTNPIWFQTLRLSAEMLPPKIAPKVSPLLMHPSTYRALNCMCNARQ
jgi:hypothetical protein